MDVSGVAVAENKMEEQHQQQEKQSHRENFEMSTTSAEAKQSSSQDDASPSPLLPSSDEESEPQEENNYLLVHVGNECFHASNIVVSHNDEESRIHPIIRHSSGECYEKVVEEVKLNLSTDGRGEVVAQQTPSLPSPLQWTVIRNVKTSRLYYLCEKCQAGISDLNEKHNHAQLHLVDSQAVVCGLCGWFLKPNGHAISRHKYIFHKEISFGESESQFNFSCKNCKVLFKNLRDFRNHQGFGCPNLSSKLSNV